MKTVKVFLCFLVAAAFASPIVANADVSYSKKKAGGVPFSKSADEVANSDDATTVVDPSAIEPAAGAEEDADASAVSSDQTGLADDMKLPRK